MFPTFADPPERHREPQRIAPALATFSIRPEMEWLEVQFNSDELYDSCQRKRGPFNRQEIERLSVNSSICPHLLTGFFWMYRI